MNLEDACLPTAPLLRCGSVVPGPGSVWSIKSGLGRVCTLTTCTVLSLSQLRHASSNTHHTRASYTPRRQCRRRRHSRTHSARARCARQTSRLCQCRQPGQRSVGSGSGRGPGGSEAAVTGACRRRWRARRQQQQQQLSASGHRPQRLSDAAAGCGWVRSAEQDEDHGSCGRRRGQASSHSTCGERKGAY